MKQFILKIVHNKKLMRYLFMAVIIVGIELISFQIIFVLSHNYYVATVVSFAIGVVLNWIGGRMFIFGHSSHHPLKEFSMILVGSLVGVFIQVAVVHIAVIVFLLYPFIGKSISIVFSFFWNYLFRARFVYK